MIKYVYNVGCSLCKLQLVSSGAKFVQVPPPSISWMPLENGAKTNGSGFFSWKYLAKLNFPRDLPGETNASHSESMIRFKKLQTGKPASTWSRIPAE